MKYAVNGNSIFTIGTSNTLDINVTSKIIKILFPLTAYFI